MTHVIELEWNVSSYKKFCIPRVSVKLKKSSFFNTKNCCFFMEKVGLNIFTHNHRKKRKGLVTIFSFEFIFEIVLSVFIVGHFLCKNDI